MNIYLMEIHRFFGGSDQFKVVATDKADAIIKAREHMQLNPHFWCGNHMKDTLRVVKKTKDKVCDCFGKPILSHTRAEYECWECPFEHECEAKRKENQHEHCEK